MKLCTPDWIDERLAQASHLWLFLDYDGTLAEFAPTPDHVLPDPELAALLTRLVRYPRINVGVVSGRRLSHIKALVPIPGVLLAGTYGVELQAPTGEQWARVEYNTIRPVLEQLKPQWQSLAEGHEGFFLEDKGWALALHARFADAGEAERVVTEARQAAAELASGDPFRILGGDRFLEVAPRLAHKGRTVAYLLDRYAGSATLPLYLGDDDKDEEAFEVIKERGGIAILVSSEPRETMADCRLESPLAARQWLETLPLRLKAKLQTTR